MDKEKVLGKIEQALPEFLLFIISPIFIILGFVVNSIYLYIAVALCLYSILDIVAVGRSGYCLTGLPLIAIALLQLSIMSVPNFISYQTRGYNSAAQADIKGAFVAAQKYFEDHPNGVVTLPLLKKGDSLKKYYFVISKGVEIKIISGTKNGLKISSTHSKGDKIYEVDAEGKITFRKKE